MKFKTESADRLASEWNNPKLSPMVKAIVTDAEQYAAEKWNWEFMITSVFRTKLEDQALQASGIHGGWRAVDVRTKDQTQAAINDVADYINKKYQYDPKRPNFKVCFKEVHGNAAHAHFQVHERTVARDVEEVATVTSDGAKILEPVDVAHQIYYELTPERRAVLDLIGFTEGTDRKIDKTPVGYNIFFTFATFTDFSKHPNVKHKSGGLVSTAAGRYQFLTKTWNSINSRLSKSGFKGFPTFEPKYQDQGALFLIDVRGALDDVDKGNLKGFLEAGSWEWASLPAPSTNTGRFGQPNLTVKKCTEIYKEYLELWSK